MRTGAATLLLALFGASASMAVAQDTTVLRLNRPVTRELARNERQTWSLDLRANQFVLGEADQHDLDVVVRVYDPNGAQIRAFDSPARGPEPFTFSSTQAGRYHIVVHPFDANGPGRYTMRLLRVEALGRTPERRVDQIFAPWDRPGSPGASVAIERNGRILYEAGYGEAQLEYHIPIEASTVFHVASVSKQVTAFAIAMLAAQGRLSLDDDVRRYIPELPDLGTPTTLRQLLHHTSGWRDQWALLGLAGWRLDDVITKDQILRLLARQRELNFAPGAEHLYSNTGYTLAAEVVARVSGQSFPAWTRRYLFEPLGMTRTHFHDDHQMIVPDRAYSFSSGPAGLQHAVLSYANAGATSLFTTAGDLARWMHNLGTGAVGGPEVLAMMMQRGRLTRGDSIPYALGLTHGTLRGLRTIGHGGADAGFRSSVLRFPDQQFSVVVLSNLGDVNAGQLAAQVAEVYLEREMTPVQAPPPAPAAPAAAVAVARERLDAYAGEFELIGAPLRIVFTRAGERLTGQATGQPPFTLTAQSDSVFVLEQAGARFVFHRETSGEVRRFTLTQGGQTIAGRRVDAPADAPADPAVYAGIYDSPELETTYTLVLRGDTLIAQHLRHDPITLTRVRRDEYRGNVWFFGETRFERDAAGAITGMRVSNGRVRNLLFVRRTGAVAR